MTAITELFEAAWCNDFKYYARVYNPETKKSYVKDVDPSYEGFVPDPKGIWACFTDPNIKLRKFHGRSKDMHGNNVYGATPPVYRYIRDNFWEHHQYNLHPNIWYLDIETRALSAPDPQGVPNEVVLIQIFDTFTNTEYVLGRKDWQPEEDYKIPVQVKYLCIPDEVQLLDAFLKLFNKLNPLLIYAWNGDGFDFPYLFNRIMKVGLDVNRMSNYGNVTCESNDKSLRQKWDLKSDGHYFLDLMDVYKKFTFAPRASYSLENISSVELGEHKIDHSEYTDFDSAYTGLNYEIKDAPIGDRIREEIRQIRIAKGDDAVNDPEYLKKVNFMFVYYGIQDVVLLKNIDAKLGFTNICLGIAQMMGVQISDSLGTVKPWSQYIANMAYLENKVLPPRRENPTPNIVGGFVREPVKGKQEWLCNLDYNSMYPMLSISGHNMSPETYVPIAKLPNDLKDYILRYFNDQNEQARLALPQEVWDNVTALLQKYNYALAINGAVFDKSHEGLIPRLVNEIYDNRKKDKKTMQKYEAQKVKIGEILSKRGINIHN